MSKLNFHIVTLFPEAIRSYGEASILKKAQEQGRIAISYYNPMDYTKPRTADALPQRVDQKPYGGGPGMVVRAEPIMEAIKDAVGKKRNVLFVHFAPRGEYFTNTIAQEIAANSQTKTAAVRDIVLICGRYEGIDSRIEEMFPGRRLSVGDYVLTGGELPAMIVIDAVSRQLPGVLGCSESKEEERGGASGAYYTRPEVIQHRGKQYKVPQVLLEGDHKKIEEWRKSHH